MIQRIRCHAPVGIEFLRLQQEYDRRYQTTPLFRKKKDMNTNTQTLALITAAILAGTPIQFDYVDADGVKTTDRIVDPENVFVSKVDGIKLKGVCRLRSGVRSFKIDSMGNVRNYVAPPPQTMVTPGDFVNFKGSMLLVHRGVDERVHLVYVRTGEPWSSSNIHFVRTPGKKDSVPLKNLVGLYFPESDYKVVKVEIKELTPVLAPRYFRCTNNTGHVKIDADGTVYFGGHHLWPEWRKMNKYRGLESLRAIADFDSYHTEVSTDPVLG